MVTHWLLNTWTLVLKPSDWCHLEFLVVFDIGRLHIWMCGWYRQWAMIEASAAFAPTPTWQADHSWLVGCNGMNLWLTAAHFQSFSSQLGPCWPNDRMQVFDTCALASPLKLETPSLFLYSQTFWHIWKRQWHTNGAVWPKSSDVLGLIPLVTRWIFIFFCCLWYCMFWQ